jgi:hypothetical protein
MSGENGETGIAARFKQALQETEQSRDPAAVASLFEEGAQLTNLGGDHGTDARKFWQVYLDQFQEIRSEFTGDIISERSAALEWQSRGRLKDGREVDYRGVSVIDFGGDKLSGFRTYYDSAEFVRAKATTAA